MLTSAAAFRPDPITKPAPHQEKLHEASRALEASFLAEMLKSAGFGKARDTFGGGTGEDQFSSFLVREYADRIVDSGGLGLAESLFEALKERQNVPV